MSTIADISEALGDFMLKGYVLTDQSCPTPGCTVPMMRTPRGKTPVLTFCVKCSEEKSKAAREPVEAQDTPSISNGSTASQPSRSSTPPTELSTPPDSPVYEFPPESEETRRRREQSDRASSRLGQKLLQGWAMLADECPNGGCYGVPLVRPPKTGGEINPQKVCVICDGIYKSETDWAGREVLVPFNTQHQELLPPVPPKLDNQDGQRVIAPSQNPTLPQPVKKNPPLVQQPNSCTLEDTTNALQQSLQALTLQLTSLSSQTFLDTTSIASTADAISKVCQALAQVKRI